MNESIKTVAENLYEKVPFRGSFEDFYNSEFSDFMYEISLDFLNCGYDFFTEKEWRFEFKRIDSKVELVYLTKEQLIEYFGEADCFNYFLNDEKIKRELDAFLSGDEISPFFNTAQKNHFYCIKNELNDIEDYGKEKEWDAESINEEKESAIDRFVDCVLDCRL